jgi:hypothetical protein
MTPRPKIEYTSLEHIESFLKIMQDIHPDTYIMLTGGEPTLYPELEKVCELIRDYGFHPSMLTNGCKIVPVDWFDAIMIDDHGSLNVRDVAKWLEHLKDYKGIWDMHEKYYHQDMQVAFDNNITKGLRCANFLKPLTLWKDVIYPCCNVMCLEWWWDEWTVTSGFRREGWTIDNPDFKWLLENWRETLPLEFYRICTLKCWRDASKVKWVRL